LRDPSWASATPPANPASAAPPAIIGTFALPAALATVSPDCAAFFATVAGRLAAFLTVAFLAALARPFVELRELDRDFVARLFVLRFFDLLDPELLALVCGILGLLPLIRPKWEKPDTRL
jgi:hypothetical protein